MNQMEALQKIQALGVATFETRDAAALLRITTANASGILRRLAGRGHLRKLAHGQWAVGDMSRSLLAEQVARPYPAYVSLQTALFRHGVIEQVPAITYAVTLGRPRKVATPAGTVSLHRVPPELFGGFAVAADGSKQASVEKALFDVVYLSPTRSRLFVRLPELELPRSFRWAETARWTRRIAGKSRQAFVAKKLTELRACQK
jgi:predicted transcriptional regulator of viral defense system